VHVHEAVRDQGRVRAIEEGQWREVFRLVVDERGQHLHAIGEGDRRQEAVDQGIDLGLR